MMSHLETACSLNAIRWFLVICFLALVQFEFGCSPSLAREIRLGDEQIRPDFSNVRGLNYIASYAASDVAMWRNYDHDQIDRELSYVAGMGVNSIRVWLAWVVYEHEGDRFVGKFSDFLSLCEKHHITVMPILWDSCFGDPLATYDSLHDWVPNPGRARVSDPEFRVKGDEYVRKVVKAGRASPALLIWDVMNEPSGPSIHDWLKHYCQLVKSLDEKHPITIGWAAAQSNRRTAGWTDVLSYHPYGILDENRKQWTDEARKISKSHGDKPILVTEAGSPGYGQRYEDCIAFCDREQIGFYLFEAMIGVDRFRNVSGFFFPDGSIRELDPVLEFQALAQRQGVTGTRRYPIQPTLLPYTKASPDELIQYIQHWNDRTWTKDNSVGRENILRWMLVSLAWGQFLDGRAPELLQQQASFETALKAGEPARSEKILAEMAQKAAQQLALHHLIKKEVSFEDFSWIHGANFTPSFAATDVEFWLKYDRQVVDRELGFAQQMGLNCVRVFLQELVFQHDPDQFLENFDHFVSTADRRGLKVMPILFDSCFGVSPSLESQHIWVANPGPDRMSQEDFETLDRFVQAVVSRHVGDHRIAMWDILNEPTVTTLSITDEGKAEIWAFVKHYCEQVRKLDPTHAITIGSAADDNNHVHQWVDVLSCHSYGASIELFRERLAETEKLANEWDKPWIISECCAPGWGNPYEMVMPELRKRNIGHTVWEVVIGRNMFAPISGLFYPDGTVRRKSSVEAVVGWKMDELVEKPDSEGVPIARGDPNRIAEYTRFMARNDVTEMTWHERTTAIYSGLTRSASAEERDLGMKRLETARAAYARGDSATAFEIATSMMKEMAKKQALQKNRCPNVILGLASPARANR